MTQTATTEAPPEAEDIGDKAPDPRLLPLQEEYDRLLGVRADLERPASRAEKLDGIAEAVRAGEPVPDLWLNIDARALQVDGVTRTASPDAREQIDTMVWNDKLRSLASTL